MNEPATSALAYWVVQPGRGELRREPLPLVPARGETRVQAAFGAVSAGTERLVGLGLVPDAATQTMACRGMRGSFALPVKYGYSLVGTAVSGAQAGRRVFGMHPHQDVADLPDEHLLDLPADLPAPRAVLVPNLETALNAVWDAELDDGEDVAVFGAGAVGLLVAYCLAKLHRGAVTVVDAARERRRLAAALPFVPRVLAPPEVEGGRCAVAFHATAAAEGLQQAIDAVGFEGRVVDLTWYGAQRVALDLGTTFHCQRKRLLASQVAAVAKRMRATHGAKERLDEVLRLLRDPVLDALLGPPWPFADLPALMRQVYGGCAAGIVPLVAYPGSTVEGQRAAAAATRSPPCTSR